MERNATNSRSFRALNIFKPNVGLRTTRSLDPFWNFNLSRRSSAFLTGESDVFLMKFSSFGVRQWTVQRGTLGADECAALQAGTSKGSLKCPS